MRNCKLCRLFWVAITLICWMVFFPLSLSKQLERENGRWLMQALHAVETAELIGQSFRAD